ncbi:MAG: hypothetical protein WCT77_05260, partial [Bacteroidota bacterium]
ERSNISIAYGIYFRMPEFQYMYDNFNTYLLRGNQMLGDPNMYAQRENSYEVAYKNQLTDLFMFNISAYYKDIYNQLGAKYVPTVPTPFWQYTVSEYGNSKGIEFEFVKRATSSDHFGFTLNYVLSSANGTSSSPGANYQLPLDTYTGLPSYALSEFPMSFDRRHKVNFNVFLLWSDNQGPSIGGIQPLENITLNFTTIFQTGSPYTVVDLKGRAIGELNTGRGPNFWRTDMRLSKMFYLRDWFGESMGTSSVEFFFDVNNLFNLRGVTGFYTTSRDPNDDGVSFYYGPGSFSSTPWYKEANFGMPETFMPDQYDNFGNRLYNLNSDFDNNGIVTQNEKFQAFKKNLEVARKFQGNNQTPITVWFGLMFKF